jgi:hypothetical protein
MRDSRLLVEWQHADKSEHVPNPNPQKDGADPVFIGSRPTGKTVVVGEEARETIYSDDIKPVDLEAVR